MKNLIALLSIFVSLNAFAGERDERPMIDVSVPVTCSGDDIRFDLSLSHDSFYVESYGSSYGYDDEREERPQFSVVEPDALGSLDGDYVNYFIDRAGFPANGGVFQIADGIFQAQMVRQYQNGGPTIVNYATQIRFDKKWRVTTTTEDIRVADPNDFSMEFKTEFIYGEVPPAEIKGHVTVRNSRGSSYFAVTCNIGWDQAEAN